MPVRDDTSVCRRTALLEPARPRGRAQLTSTCITTEGCGRGLRPGNAAGRLGWRRRAPQRKWLLLAAVATPEQGLRPSNRQHLLWTVINALADKVIDLREKVSQNTYEIKRLRSSTSQGKWR